MTPKLYGVISHPTKLEILRSITINPEKIETIARKVDISPQETKIHLDNLKTAGLIDMESNNTYLSSPFGQLVLSLFISFDFVASQPEYFRNLNLSLVPLSFVERLGELKESQRIEGTVSNIQNAEELIARAEKKISVVANELILDSVPVVRDKISRGADFKFIHDHTFKPPNGFKITIPKLWRKVWKIPAAVVVTDNEAVVFFLNRNLAVDYSVGFTSTEPAFMKWCDDLVDHLWKQGEQLQ